MTAAFEQRAPVLLGTSPQEGTWPTYFFHTPARTRRAPSRSRKGLEQAGLDVFWDNEIPPGTTWADYIEQKLTQCKALIVLWSEHSTKSQWVREEARMGRDKGVLIPVMIDASQPPFGFGEVQAANLATWNGEADNPNWRRFVDAVIAHRAEHAEPRRCRARRQRAAACGAGARRGARRSRIGSEARRRAGLGLGRRRRCRAPSWCLASSAR